ncbi:ATP-binding protein, partial [Hansschlegelia beijingensis]
DVVTLPLPDGGTLATFTDVTARVNVERALRDRAEAVEAAARLKADFTSHVSYELRSPLTNIIGFGQLLGDPRLGALSPKQREYVDHILSSSSALLAIINDILDLTTIDAGAMELELGPVNARDAIDGAVEGVRDRLAEAGLGLEIDAPPSVGTFVADGKRVRQILFNLLANAIGFSKPGHAVSVSAERTQDAMIFRVADKGSGISPELADKVFDRFESRTAGAAHRGVGLGLSIVRSFVELHGGSVALDSRIGEGTVVTCRFPLAVSFAVALETQEEIDRLWEALIADGGAPRQCGWLVDRYGFPWQVFPSFVLDLLGDPARGPRMMAALMEMVKLDVAALKAAAEG